MSCFGSRVRVRNVRAVAAVLLLVLGLLHCATARGQELRFADPRVAAVCTLSTDYTAPPWWQAPLIVACASSRDAEATHYFSAPQSSATPQAPASKAAASNAKSAPVHRFWDRTNDWLCAGVGLVRGLDFASTRNFRARHRNEVLLNNEIVDNLPAFAAIEAAGAATSVGFSYLLHRTGHHRLERALSIAHISITTVGSIHNYVLETGHPRPAPAAGARGLTVAVPVAFFFKR